MLKAGTFNGSVLEADSMALAIEQAMESLGVFDPADDTPEAVVLRTPGAEDQRIARGEIRQTSYLNRSLMPEGLLEALPPQQVSDLFSYLKTLK